jgi:hypothetical protein
LTCVFAYTLFQLTLAVPGCSFNILVAAGNKIFTTTGGDDNAPLLDGSGTDSLDGGLGDDPVRGQGGADDTAIGGGGIDIVVP